MNTEQTIKRAISLEVVFSFTYQGHMSPTKPGPLSEGKVGFPNLGLTSYTKCKTV